MDAAAFDDLYRRLEKPLYNVVYRWLWNPADAHEVVQEAFVRLWSRREEVRLETVEPLVFRIAVNLAASRHRWKRRWGWLGLGGLSERPTPEAGADRTLESDERERALRAAVEALPEKLRQVILLCEMSGLSYEGVSQALSIPVGTVGSRRNAALARLRELLEGTDVR